jgi:hypothetical protein
MSTYSLIGHVIGTAGAHRVEAWDATGILGEMIDVAETDAAGDFQMQLASAYLTALLPQAKPVLAFRVFAAGKAVAQTKDVEWTVAQLVTELRIPIGASAPATNVSATPAYTPAQAVVRGAVVYGDGTPMVGAIVRAFDRNLSASGLVDTQLGQATSDAAGGFTIEYGALASGKLKPDLIVQAFAAATATATAPKPAGTTTTTPAATATPIATSALIPTAPTVAIVELCTDAAIATPIKSEHLLLATALQPVLDRSKLAITDLTTDHVAYVAGTSGISADRVRMMMNAASYSKAAGGTIDPEVWYGVLRGGYVGNTASLIRSPISQVRERLEAAAQNNNMSASLAPNIDALTTAFRDAVVAAHLPANGAVTPISSALGNALATSDVQRAFLTLYVARDGSPSDVWAAVAADATLGPHAADLQTTLRFHVLFGGFQPALAELNARRQAGTVTDARTLARWQDSDWQAFVTKVGTPPGVPGAAQADKVTAYAAGLSQVARRAFPTEYLRGVAAQPIPPLSLKFLPALAAANPTLDLRRPLPANPNWGSIPVAEQSAAMSEWNAFRAEARAFDGMPARTLLAQVVAGAGVSPVRAVAYKALSAATDLDLEATTVDNYVAAHPTWLSSAGVTATQQVAVLGYLQSVQRITRVVDEPKAIDTLLGDGVDSAGKIAQMSRAQFVERYQTVIGGADAAASAASKAFQIAATAQVALASVAYAYTSTTPWAVGGGSMTKFAVPNYAGALQLLQQTSNATAATWPTLFGGDSWCDCDDCQAAWGPAAYFVSLLQLLDAAHQTNTPVDQLFARRPDLQYLPLTCDNVNTPIPVIDLANEILEIAAANLLKIPVNIQSYDSTGIAPEVIRAVPQNVIAAVYAPPAGSTADSLANQIYPFTLPFHRPLAVVRAYLDQLGTSYRDVYGAFGPLTSSPLTRVQHLAAETLALSVFQFQIITTARTGADLAKAYGYTGSEPPPNTWEQQLAVVTTLLQRTGLSYDDLYAVSWTYFVSPLAPATRPQLQAPVQCQIDGTSYLNATDDTWDRIQRFVRLRAKTPWSIADLDRALYALCTKDASHAVTLDAGGLVKIAGATRIANALTLPSAWPIAALLALWGDIDTWGSDSLYLLRFANPTVAQLAGTSDPTDATAFDLAGYDPTNPQYKPASGGQFELNGAAAGKLLANFRPQLLAALGIAATDLDAIWAFEQATLGVSPALNLHNVSILFRYTVLATGLALRIADVITLLELSGATPFASPHETQRFINLAQLIGATGIAIPTLDYVYRHDLLPGQGPAPSDSVVLASLIAIWSALRAVAQDTAVTDDPDATLLATRLAQLLTPAVVPQLVAALDPTTAPTAARQAVIAMYLAPTIPAATNAIFATPDPTPPAALPPSPPPTSAQIQQYQADLAAYQLAAAARKAANQTALLQVVSAWLCQSLSQSAVVSAVAGQLGLPDAMTLPLLAQWIPGDGANTALQTMLGLAAGGLTLHTFAQAAFGGAETVAATPTTVALTVTQGSPTPSARWIGFLMPAADGAQRLIVRTDGAGSITVGTTKITFAAGTAITDHELDVTLSASALAPITVEYDSAGNAGQIQLLWYTPAAVGAAPTPAQPITADYLFPATGITALDGTSGPGFAWRRAHKASLLIAGLGLDAATIEYAQSAAQPFGAFALSALPMAPPADATVHAMFETFYELARFAAFEAALATTTTAVAAGAATTTLVDALTWTNPSSDPATQLSAWTAEVCAAGGWDPTIVGPLLATSGVDYTKSGTAIVNALLAPLTPETTLSARLVALQTAITLIKRVGVDAVTLRSWTATEPDASAANEIIQAVRASYADNTTWLSVAQTRNDSLRQLQRDALVAFLLPRLNVTVDGAPLVDANSLFEYFLIDVEMCACGQTSRIVQASASAQLFIQRIMLDLEPGISSTWIDPATWEWQSEYRVWQANREIFLYPENWIDPELRVDKTPLFTDLQSQLAQGALDADSIEAAFLGYLQGLQDVSRLRVCAMSWQQDTSTSTNPLLAAEKTIDTLHVIARTQGAQPVFYYGTLLGVASGGGGSEWTPWEKVGVDILGDGQSGDVQMVLATYDRRLYLFWCQFTEVAEPNQPGATEGQSPPPGLSHWEIRLAWTSYRDGVWAPKQLTTDYLRSDRYIEDNSENEQAFATALNDYQLDVNKAKAKYDAQVDLVTAMEELVVVLCAILAAQIVAASPILGFELLFLSGDLDVLGASTLPAMEKMCSGMNTSFEDVIADIFEKLDGWPNAAFTVTKSAIDSNYEAVLAARKTETDLETTYDQMAQALADFYSGQSALSVTAYTERSDYTSWSSFASGGVKVYVVRHDDDKNPLELGYFTLSDDGRSVSVTSAAANTRLDLTNNIPGHSSPNTNAFAIDTTKYKSLDLDGLPKILGSMDGGEYFDEHDYQAPVSATHPRPFAVSKGSEVDVALPNPPQRTLKLAPGRAWTVAAPKGGWVYQTPVYTAGPIDVGGPVEGGTIANPIVNPIVGTSPVAGTLQVDSTLVVGTNAIQTDSAHVVGQPIVGRSYAEQIVDTSSFEITKIPVVEPVNTSGKLFRFEALRHPFVENMIKNLERDGVPGVLTLASQNPTGADAGTPTGHFAKTLVPSTKYVDQPYAVYDVDFRPQGAYSLYNWELFFHAPMLIAARLLTDGQQQQALSWLQYIFNPQTSSTDAAPDRYWNLQWFRDHDTQTDAAQLMTALAENTPADVVAEINAEIAQWQEYPADPHRIARLRTSAYQKAIVFAYLDTLIAWGDALFTQNTLETINQATQLYVLASHLLGPRPEHVPQTQAMPTFCYDDLRNVLDSMTDTVESMLHPDVIALGHEPKFEARAMLGIGHIPVVYPSQAADPSLPQSPLVFCVPANSKLLGYFDTLDDRLFKIRNCMNISGQVQQLPLFQPPIDPALLVQAAALGLDLASVLANLSAPLPFQRFAVTYARAVEVTADLRQFGGQLLGALEKQDAETLALLRATQETAVQNAVLAVKQQQVQDAQLNKIALQKTRDMVQAKHDYYASRPYMNAHETVQQLLMQQGMQQQLMASTMTAASTEMSMIPEFELGPTGMGVHGTAGFGGMQISAGIKAMAEAMAGEAQSMMTTAQASGILGGFDRRSDDWGFQADQATKELAQIDQQLAAADIKIAIANLDVQNQQLLIANAQKVEDTLRAKYTNVELYQWMVGQVATTYYGAYKVAYDLAQRAERCYQYELGITDSRFIQFGYWDSLHKGLLAGEQLALDLRRLESSYLQNNRRYYEITRQISLVLHDPTAFAQLRDTGSCTFDLPEAMFDADYPGHYFRRIQNVALTLPCVAGPYTPINCTLTLLSSSVRTAATAPQSSPEKTYPEANAPNDARFSHSYGAIQSVATSHGQNDAGMFEVSFKDERYLPFEGAGAISSWRLDLPLDTNAFDFDTLADVVIKLAYTARDGGVPLATAARASLASQRKTVAPAGQQALLQRMYRVRYEFSDAWIAFRNAAASGAAQLQLVLDASRFPFLFRANTIGIAQVDLYLTSSNSLQPFTATLTPPGAGATAAQLNFAPSHNGATVVSATWGGPSGTPVAVKTGAATWTLSIAAGSPAATQLASARDLILVATYTVA